MAANVKKCKWHSKTVGGGTSLIFPQIIRNINAYNLQDFPIDIDELRKHLSSLQPRIGAAVIEIILNYETLNPDIVKVARNKDAPPYGGVFNQNNLSTSFDLNKLPDSLVIILWEFCNLSKTATTTK